MHHRRRIWKRTKSIVDVHHEPVITPICSELNAINLIGKVVRCVWMGLRNAGRQSGERLSASKILNQQKLFQLFTHFPKHKLNWLRSPLSLRPRHRTVLFNAHLRRDETRARNVSWCFAFRHKLEENQGKLSKCFSVGWRSESWRKKNQLRDFQSTNWIVGFIADCTAIYCFCAMKYSFQWKYREKKKSIHKKLMKIPRTIVKSFKRLFRAILGL